MIMLTFGRMACDPRQILTCSHQNSKWQFEPIVASKHAILRAVLVMLSDPQSRESAFNDYEGMYSSALQMVIKNKTKNADIQTSLVC
jgi:hypothetical protein